jgi:hypothetical protein
MLLTVNKIWIGDARSCLKYGKHTLHVYAITTIKDSCKIFCCVLMPTCANLKWFYILKRSIIVNIVYSEIDMVLYFSAVFNGGYCLYM